MSSSSVPSTNTGSPGHARSDFDSAYLDIVKNPQVYQDGLEESASVILTRCAHALSVSRTSLWLVSEDRSGMTCLVLYDAATDEFESGAVLRQDVFPAYFEALHNGRVLAAPDARTDKRTNELAASYLEVLDVRSLLDATIRNARDGQLQGVLCAEMIGERRDWNHDEEMFVASVSDLLSQRLITREWARTSQNYQAVFESSREGIFVHTSTGLLDGNAAAEEMFGATEIGLSACSRSDLSPEYQPDGQLSAAKADRAIEACLAGIPQKFEWRHKRLDDDTEFDAEVTLKSVSLSGDRTLVAMVRDVTSEKEAQQQARIAQSQLEYRAAHDSLTGLMNREQLHLHVQGLIDQVQHWDQHIVLLLLDLNRFKEINDTLGHATGDGVLVKLAERLEDLATSLNGALFRLGGDEFVAVFDSKSCPQPLEDISVIIEQRLKSPIQVDGVHFDVSAAIGAAMFPVNGRDSHELLRCADVAMYHAKNHDGASPWYSQENDVHDRRRLSMAAELRQAIQEDELLLHFQPRINIKTGEITGCEALVRWVHPTRGLIPPSDFLPLAEMTELIHPLTAWVVDSAFGQINRFRSLGLHVPVAVNLSARNLPDSQLFDQIEAHLASEDICPEVFEVEITESALINDPQRSVQNLLRLEKLGVSIAIDDFGTGYSSLSLLKKLPLDTLKIDRSFVDEMLSSEPDRVIVQSTVSLAHNFSSKAVAEGVENQETLDALLALKCDEAQGFFIARPMPVEKLEAWIVERTHRESAA